MPQYGAINGFLEQAINALEQGILDAVLIEKIYRRGGFDARELTALDFTNIAKVITQDFLPPGQSTTFGGINRLVLDFLWSRLPQQDCTEIVRKALKIDV